MPRIATVNSSNTDLATQTTLDAVKAKIGMVPNLFATFAQSPAVLNGYLAFSDALATGRLTAAQREIIALATAQANECHYCLSAHTLMGKGAGLSADAIAAARNGVSSNPVDNAIAKVATLLVRDRGILSDDVINGARAAGLDDGLVIEIIANVSINLLTNYTNHVAETEIDFPVVDINLERLAA